MSLGENIYRLRTEKKMSQGDLADALDVSRQSVSKWENNNATPDLERMVKLSNLFGITLDELVNGKAQEKAPTVQTVTTESRQSLPANRIIGIILLAFSLLFFLMLFFSTSLSALLPCLLLSAPFFTCGIICLKAKKHIGLYCLFALYLFLWLPMGIFAPNYIRIDFAKVIQSVHILFGGGLVYWGWRLHQKKKFLERHRPIIVFFAIMILSILVTYLFLRFPGLLPDKGLLSY